MQIPRPLRWVVPSRDEIRDLPDDVKDEIGFKLRRVQNGEHGGDKDIKPFGEDPRIAHLIKIVAEGDDGNTYRAAVAAEFPEGLWVLDVFEKRASRGIRTPKKDIDRIARRLQRLNEYRATADGLKVIAGMKAETEAAKKSRSTAHTRNPTRRR